MNDHQVYRYLCGGQYGKLLGLFQAWAAAAERGTVDDPHVKRTIANDTLLCLIAKYEKGELTEPQANRYAQGIIRNMIRSYWRSTLRRNNAQSSYEVSLTQERHLEADVLGELEVVRRVGAMSRIDQRIVGLIRHGHSQRDIATNLKISRHRVREAVRSLNHSPDADRMAR